VFVDFLMGGGCLDWVVYLCYTWLVFGLCGYDCGVIDDWVWVMVGVFGMVVLGVLGFVAWCWFGWWMVNSNNRYIIWGLLMLLERM